MFRHLLFGCMLPSPPPELSIFSQHTYICTHFVFVSIYPSEEGHITRVNYKELNVNIDINIYVGMKCSNILFYQKFISNVSAHNCHGAFLKVKTPKKGLCNYIRKTYLNLATPKFLQAHFCK